MSGSLPRSLLIGALALVMVTSTLFGGALAALTGPGAHPAGSVINVIILPDGKLSTPAPISISGNTYTLTQEINGTIVDERNGSTLNGAGHRLNSTGSGSTAVGLYGVTGVTVERLNITNASEGVSIQNSSAATVENNTITAATDGIVSAFSGNLSVIDNHLFPVGPRDVGVYLQSGTRARVTGNEADGFYKGIATYLYQGVLISGNNVSRSEYGAYVESSSDTTLLGNLADNSTYGLYLSTVQQANVSLNHAVYSDHGIYLDYSDQVTGYGNVVSHSRSTGLYLDYDVGVVLAGTVASYGYIGFDVYETSQFDLKGGTAVDSTDLGLYVEYSSSGTFSGLNASGSLYPAYLYYTEGMVTLQNANVSYGGVGYGVYAEESSLTMIGGSVYGERSYAIYTYYALQVRLIDLNGTGASNTYLLYDEYSASVNVTGGRLSGYDYALYLEYESSVTVTGTTFVNDYSAGYTDSSGVVTLKDLTVLGGADSEYGWYDDYSASVTVVNGTYQDLPYGVVLYYEQTDRVIGANFLNNSDYGILTEYAGSVSLSGVRVTGSVRSTDGFYDYASGRESVVNSSFPGLEYGIYLEYDGPAWVYNVSSQGSYAGVYAYYPYSLTVAHSQFNLDNYSLELYTSDAAVTDNTATGAGIPLYGYYWDQGSVSGNNFSGAKSYAAWFTYVSDANISDNNFSGAGSYALALDYSTASVAWGNDLSHSLWGFELNNSTGITLFDNRIAGDPWAFSLNNSSLDLFYHNNFINDAQWVFKGAVSQNAWADGYPVGGNYWSGYTGKDLNHGPNQNLPGPDGIGDTPYALGSGNVDPYPLMKPWTSPVLTFSETGLPSGTLWNVTVNGTRLAAAAPDPILYPQVNGAYTSYDYTVGNVAGYFAQPATGNGTYRQSEETIPIHFWTVNYTVTFAQTGLPANTSWGVKLSFAGGLQATGNSSTLALDAANGTWDYQLQAPTGYEASPSSGNLTVRGSSVTVSIVFRPIPYTVSFTQQGLPVGLNWTVRLPGLNLSGPASGNLDASLPNGTYAFVVGTTVVSSSQSYVPTPVQGNLTVNGSAVSVRVSFVPVSHPTLYTVTFAPAGLPSGSSFNLSVAGRSFTGATTLVALQLPNGTYSFGVGAPAGWSVTPVQGVLTVNGTSVSVTVTFASVPSPSSSSGIPNGEYLALLALVIVLAILMVVGWLLYLGHRRKGGGAQTSPAPPTPAPTPPEAWQAPGAEPPAPPAPGSPPGSP